MITIPPQHRSIFSIAHRSWQQYRQAHCEEAIEPNHGASMAPMLYHRCLATVTNDRIADLQGLTSASEAPDLAPMQSLIEELQQDNVQQIWERYQMEYCQFESQYFGQSMRSQSCVTRLSQSRLRHLKIMMDSH